MYGPTLELPPRAARGCPSADRRSILPHGTELIPDPSSLRGTASAAGAQAIRAWCTVSLVHDDEDEHENEDEED
jgi:hypothetical protein